MASVNVEGTRRVLAAAAAVSATRIVRISSAAVYGAWPSNPVPLTEDAPLRPNPHFSPAVQGAEVERLIAGWRDEHPGVTVTTLRSAPVVGPGAERLPARILLGRPPLRVRGAAMPVQVVHVDDLATALAARRHQRPRGRVQRRRRRLARCRRGASAPPSCAGSGGAAGGPRARAPAHVGNGDGRCTTGGRAVPGASVGDRQRQAEKRGLDAEPHQRGSDQRGPVRAPAAPVRNPVRSSPPSCSPRCLPRSGSGAGGVAGRGPTRWSDDSDSLCRHSR